MSNRPELDIASTQQTRAHDAVDTLTGQVAILERDLAALRARLAEVEKERDEALFPSQQRYVTGDLPRLPDAPPTIQLRRETVREFRAAFGNALRQLARVTGLAVDDLSPLSVAGKAYDIETMRSRLSAAVETLRETEGALKRHGGHLSRCRVWDGPKAKCTCGLADVQAKARTFLDSLDTKKKGRSHE